MSILLRDKKKKILKNCFGLKFLLIQGKFRQIGFKLSKYLQNILKLNYLESDMISSNLILEIKK